MSKSLDLDEIEKRAHDEIASVDDPSVIFYPSWERSVVKQMIKDGKGPAETLALITEIRTLQEEIVNQKRRAFVAESEAGSFLEDCERLDAENKQLRIEIDKLKKDTNVRIA